MLITPRAGKSTRGSKAVIATGAASDIHQQIIQAIKANTKGACGEIKFVGKNKYTSRKRIGPAMKPRDLYGSGLAVTVIKVAIVYASTREHNVK
jgi:hypothetical protein